MSQKNVDLLSEYVSLVSNNRHSVVKKRSTCRPIVVVPALKTHTSFFWEAPSTRGIVFKILPPPGVINIGGAPCFRKKSRHYSGELT